MYPFTYSRAADQDTALKELNAGEHTKLLGGGTNLIDLMKMGVERPDKVIDINRLPLAKIEELPDGGVRIGALVRNSDLAEHPLITSRYPALSQALLAGASPQLRNMATVGGNLLQRTRCYYFYDPAFAQCNKRAPGSGCAAIEGFNRIHAILGQSEHCIATNPSDMCVAMAALEAVIHVQGSKGERTIRIRELHRLPGTQPELDTTLERDDLITAVDLPATGWLKQSHYLKVRDRASYAFALVSAATALEIEDGKIKSARVALGGVSHIPWRADQAERVLIGRKPDEATFKVAAASELESAKGYKNNEFKIELARRTIVRALTETAALA